MAIMKIPVIKGGDTIEVDTDKVHESVYAAALAIGLKHLLNTRMTKITTKDLEGPALEAAQASAMAKARENAENMISGSIKLPGVKSSKAKSGVSSVVMTEARRLARAMVKKAIKDDGKKISDYAASEITKAANSLIAADPRIIEAAKASVDEQEAQADAVTAKLAEITSAIPVDEKKVKANKAKAEKAKADKVLSATQAGKTATRKKGSQTLQAN